MGDICEFKVVFCEHCCCYSGCGKESEIITHKNHRRYINQSTGNFIEGFQEIKYYPNGNKEEKTTFTKGNIYKDKKKYISDY